MSTPPPLRLVMKSYDKLAPISMKVTWNDEDGQEHSWNSWEDALCGRCGATKVLPSTARDIQVRFRTQPGGRKVHAVDRRNRCAWRRCGEEVIHLRAGSQDVGVDAWFELRGPLTHCHVWRAWNACNQGLPEDWEFWPDFPADRRAALPATLQAADAAAPWPGEGSPKNEEYTSRVAGTMSRLVAAAEVLLAVRQRTLRALEELNEQLTKQWFRVNSGNTVAAGLAVASFGSLFVAPPMGVALGASSAAMGLGSRTGDAVAEADKGRSLAKLMEVDSTEQLAFESVESELRCVLARAAAAAKQRQTAPKAAALAAYAQTANLVLVRSAKYIALSQAGAEGVALAGRLLGGVGAGLAVGVAVHGWSTLKPMQKLVKEKIDEIQRSMEYLEGLRKQMCSALVCPGCGEALSFGREDLRRCSRFHCFHARCVEQEPSCPQCLDPVAKVKSSDQLNALLWLAGLRDFCAVTLEALGPQLQKANDRLQRLAAEDVRGLFMKSAPEEVESPSSFSSSPKKMDEAPQEVAEAHVAWEAAELTRYDSSDPGATAAARVVVERLLLDHCGMPLKHRHRLWPLLLGCRPLPLPSLEPPAKVIEQIDADVPRTRHSLVAGRTADLRCVLRSLSVHRPEIGYAQGMNQLAAVFLKLGFDNEMTFSMMDALMQDLVPGCHDPDLHGLFRDTGVADILIQTFLPRHALAFESAGIEVLWFTVDYFLTLGSAGASLPFIACLWDLCFLWGPRAVFSGFLASLDLYFPLSAIKENADAEEQLQRYKAALAEASPDGFAQRAAEFLHERQGGISAELIASLRASVRA